MATTVIKTVKSSGGDYSSRSALEAAIPANLVTADEIWIGETYSFSDTTALVIDGHVTDATRYIELRAPAGERHARVWDTAKSYMSVASDRAITISDACVRISGQQLTHSSQSDSLHELIFINATDNGANGSDIRVFNNILKGGGNNANFESGISVYNARGTVRIWNNFIYNLGYGGANYPGIRFDTYDSNYAWNNTIYGKTGSTSRYGIYNAYSANPPSIGGNICNNNATDYSGTLTSLGYNISQDATSPDTSLRSKTVAFVSTTGGSEDFGLLVSDTAAKDTGADTSSGFFIDDIEYVTRAGTWDIGASEYVAAGSDVLNSQILM